MQHLARFGARVLRKASRVLEQWGSSQVIEVQRSMSQYDMSSRPDESYYLEQYWHWLLPELDRRFPNRQAHALDVGCGQGRLTLPLASWLKNGTVVGVDITPVAIERANLLAQQHNLTNTEFHTADALAFIQTLPSASLDVVLMLEVTFFMPLYREVISAIHRVLKPDGLFFIAFRSQYFDFLHSVRSRDWESARLVRDAREGHWGGGVSWFSWHTSADIQQLLKEAGFTLLHLYGIGIASGIEGDPLSAIAQPSTLSSTEQFQLMEIETSLAKQYADCGRYILAVAARSS